MMPIIESQAQRDALIEYCKEEIRFKAEHIARLEKHMPGQFNVTCYQLELLTAQITLAALEAEADGAIIEAINPHTGSSSKFYRKGGINVIPPSEIEKWSMSEVEYLYTAPPLPALKPVVLPSRFSPAISPIIKGNTPLPSMRLSPDNGGWLNRERVIKALCEAGYPILGELWLT